jgi:hypothetical protein
MTQPPLMSRNFTDATLVISPQHLASKAHWIRNTLDLQIAQSAPKLSAPTTCLTSTRSYAAFCPTQVGSR